MGLFFQLAISNLFNCLLSKLVFVPYNNFLMYVQTRWKTFSLLWLAIKSSPKRSTTETPFVAFKTAVLEA